MITQTLKLNLIPGQVLPRVNVSQYDAGTRTLQMLLYNGDQAFNISAGLGGFVQGTKPDRTGFQYAATVTEGSNVVTLVITQQMTAVSGEVTCELVLADGDNRIATVNFIIYVEPAALADDTVISDTELPLIEEAAELAQRIDAIATQIEQLTYNTSGLLDNTEVNGAVNMLPNLRESVVDSGITYTVNADGSVTCNGTATANTHLEPVKTADNYYLSKGIYKITGCPSGGTDNTYYIRLYNLNSSAIQIGREYGDGLVFTLTESTRIGVQIQFISGYTASNLTFKPMITVPSYNGDYVPYAKSNKELTEDVTSQEIAITPNSDYVPSSSVNVYKIGKLRFLEGYFFTSKDVPQHTVLFTVDAKPLNNNTYFMFAKGDGTFYLGKVDSNKQLQLDSNTSMSQGAYAIIGSYLVE